MSERTLNCQFVHRTMSCSEISSQNNTFDHSYMIDHIRLPLLKSIITYFDTHHYNRFRNSFYFHLNKSASYVFKKQFCTIYHFYIHYPHVSCFIHDWKIKFPLILFNYCYRFNWTAFTNLATLRINIGIFVVFSLWSCAIDYNFILDIPSYFLESLRMITNNFNCCYSRDKQDNMNIHEKSNMDNIFKSDLMLISKIEQILSTILGDTPTDHQIGAFLDTSLVSGKLVPTVDNINSIVIGYTPCLQKTVPTYFLLCVGQIWTDFNFKKMVGMFWNTHLTKLYKKRSLHL